MFSKFLCASLSVLMADQVAALRDRPAQSLVIESEKTANAEFNMRYLPQTDQVEYVVTMPREYVWFGVVLGEKDMSFGGDINIFFADGENSDYMDA